jgi:hypothetical protein
MTVFNRALASEVALEYRYGAIECRESSGGESVDTQLGLSGQAASDRIVKDAETT